MNIGINITTVTVGNGTQVFANGERIPDCYYIHSIKREKELLDEIERLNKIIREG